MAGKPKRNAGEGSVMVLPDGRYRARARRGPRGAVEETYGFGRTRKEAYADLTRKLKARKAADGRPGSGSPLAVYLAWWLDVELAGRVADGLIQVTTVGGYEQKVRLHVEPLLGRVALEDLSAADVRAWMEKLRRKGLSPRTREYAHATLRAALSAAQDYELVDRNVAKLVDAPKVERRRRPPTPLGDARALLAATAGRDLEALYRLALSVPLRPGELLGAEWSRIDLAAATLRVERNLLRHDGGWRLHDLKGHEARTVPLSAGVVEALAVQRERQAVWRGEPGWRPVDVVEVVRGLETVRAGDFVATDRWGAPRHNSHLNADLRELCEAAGVPRRTPHGLRHAAVTLLVDSGVDQAVVQQLAGHQSAAMSDLYTGVLERGMRDAVTRVEGRLAAPPAG